MHCRPAHPAARLLALLLSLLLVFEPLAANAQAIAAGTTITRIDNAPNGVPLVNIAAPNTAGISHNQYNQFNVGTNGLILNNSRTLTQTQLGGFIDGNANLASSAARLIVNEVTGTQASNLRGFMEVAGQRADVVVANPNGITCDGCGFINTARATLSTGLPEFDATGKLDAHRVGSGSLTITGNGLNGQTLDQLDLLARSIRVDAGLWSTTLNVITGPNRVTHDNLAASSLPSASAAPTQAIDIALLGGMYANKIRLLASEAGVGVNSQGKLLAQNGEFQLDAAGRITLGGQINAAQQVRIQSTHDIDHSGSTQANGTIEISSQGTLSHTGTLAAGNNLSLSGNRILSQGNLGAGMDANGRATQAGNLTAHASTTLQASGIHLAGGNIELQANSLDLRHSQAQAGQNLSLQTRTGDLDARDSQLQSGAQLTLQASGTVSTQHALIQSGSSLMVNAQNLSNPDGQIRAADAAITLSGTFDNQGGQVISQGPLNLTANRLDNRYGLIRAQGGSTGNVEITVTNTLDNTSQGRIEATGDSRLQSALLNNSGKIISDTRLSLSSNNVSNQGTIQADDLSLSAGQIDNPGSMTGLTRADIEATTRLNNTGGTLQAGNALRINSPVLDNSGGTLRSLQDMQLTSPRIDNSGGQINAARDLHIRTSNLGSGTYSAQRDLTLQVDTAYTHDASRRLLADRDLTLTVSGQLNNQGSLIAPRQLTLQATDIVTAPLSEILSETLTLQSDTVTHRGTLVATTQTLRAGQFNNTGSLFGQNITLAANSLSNRDTGVIAAGTRLDLHIRDMLDNLDGALLYSAGTLNIAADGQRDGNNRLQNPSNHIRNRSANIDAQGDMEIVAGTLDNTRTSVTTGSETLATRISLIQLKDGSWSSGVIGKSYLNGNTLLIETEKRSCDIVGQNCYTTRETTQEPIEFWTPLSRLGVSTTPPAQECDSSGCRMVSTTTNTSVQAFGAETWHIDPLGTSTFSIQALPYPGRRMAVISEDRRETLSATPEARILAGGNLILRAGTVNNLSSRIEAGGDLLASIDTLNNTGLSLKTFTRDTNWVGDCSDIKGAGPGLLGYCASGWIWTADVRDTVTGTNVSADAIIRGNRNLAITARQIDSRTLNAQGLAPGGINAASSSNLSGPTPFAFTLPTNGLYIRHSEPAARYFVETDPRFTQYANFIGSDYMLSRLGLNLDSTPKRLGDAFYEQQLVRQQLIAQRGNTAQGPYPNLNAQYQALLEAGADYAHAFALVPGIQLSTAQIAQLSRDMVWLETRVVEGQSVLVPVVYLAKAERHDTGAVIAAGQSLNLQATNIANSGAMTAGKDLALIATDTLANQSGRIAGDTVRLAAGRDLKIGTATTTVTIAPGQAFTHVGQAGSVSAQTVDLVAGQDLTLNGARIEATGQARLAAGRDLIVGSQAIATEQHVTGQGSAGQSRFDRSAVTQRGSQITAGSNLSLAAQRDLAVIGSRIEANDNLTATAGNTLAVVNARETNEQAYTARSKTVSDDRQSRTDTGQASQIRAGGNLSLGANALLVEGSTVQAGQDVSLAARNIALVANHDTESRQETYSATGKRGGQQGSLSRQADTAAGSIVQAGRNLSLQSSGQTRIEGSALAAGQQLDIKVAGDLLLAAATSSLAAQIQRSSFSSREATSLSFNQETVRQLLSTLSAGSATIEVGGNFTAATPETRPDGTLNADRMTANGILRGDSRQQVSVTRTGVGTSSNPADSQVLGNLAAQGIRNHSADSFAPTAANAPQTGQAALQQYLQSGLLQIANSPQLAGQLQSLLKNDGSTLTLKDTQGNLSLTVAGQARVEAVYNTLLLSETFDKKKFANPQTAQIVTLAAAIALTVMTGGAGAGTVGASLSSNALAATMINAAVIGMGSTMIGQLAGGASFDQAFKASVKAGATSALMAGVSYGAMSALDLHPQYDAAGNVMRDAQNNVLYQSASGAEYAKLSAIDRLTDSRFWALTAANSTAYGALAAANGGKFSPAFGSGVMSSLGANLNALVGDWAYQNNIAEGSLSKIALHAGISALQAGATKQNALAGAIGGATAEALSAFNTQLDQTTGNKAASELTTAGVSLIANQLLNKNADTSNLTAATQALQTERNNRQLHVAEKKLIRSLAEQKAKDSCQGDTQCLRSATLYWTDALERVAESRTDEKEFLKTAQYLNQLEKTATVQGSEGQLGAVSRYFADLETAARMLDPYTGKTILVNGQTAPLNGSNQTYFSATPEQRANTSENYFLGVAPDPSIIPGMAERDQTRLEQSGVKSGSVQPVYPAEEIALGGPLTSKVLGVMGRAWGALDVTLAGKVGASAGGNISTQQVTREGISAGLNAMERAQLAKLNTLSETAAQGSLREEVTNGFLARNGFTQLEGKCGSNNCFDGVFVKGDTVYVVETKPLQANGAIKLNGPEGNLPTQMTNDWVKYSTERLAETGDPVKQQTAALIDQALKQGNLVKIVAGVNENGVTLVKLVK